MNSKTFDNITNLFLQSTYGFLPLLKSGPELLVVSSYFVVYLTPFVAVAPFSLRKDPIVASRTDKFFNKALYSLAFVQDMDLSVYLKCNATACYWLFPPVHSLDRIDDNKKASNAEGSEEEDIMMLTYHS